MAEISTKARKALPNSSFADPENRAYPIHDAAHVRNAAARLEQQKGSLSPAKYRSIRAKIARAARKFGIDSEYNKKSTASQGRFARGLRMTTVHSDGSRTTIHHMSDDGVPVYLFTALSDNGSDGPVWIQLAKQGEWTGHPQGSFKMDGNTFATLIANFRANQNHEIPIDFEHASEMPPTAGSVPFRGAPAQGWIKDLRVDGSNLMALVQWGDQAREYIRSGQYKYISPAIRWKTPDRQTGKDRGATLTSAGLTNQPFLDGMRPLAASVKGAEDVAGYFEPQHAEANQLRCFSASEYLPRIKSALKLHELATPSEIGDHMSKLREYFDMAGGDHTKSVGGVNLADFALPLREIVNAHAGMSWDEIFDIIEDLVDIEMDKHIIEDHGGIEEATPPGMSEMSLNSSAEAIAVAASNNASEGGQPMAKTVEQYELEITNLTGERTNLLAEIEGLKASNQQLSAKVEAHEAQRLSARVDLAFSTYKDKFQLPPNAKSAMLSLLKADANGFESMYPEIAPQQRHLLNIHTGDANTATAPHQMRTAADTPNQLDTTRTMSARDLTNQFLRQGMSLADAQVEADKVLRKVRRAH